MTMVLHHPASPEPRNATEGMQGAEKKRALAIYLNIPFCPSRCHFCHWVQGISKKDLFLRPLDEQRQKYVAAVGTEIRERLHAMPALRNLPNVIYWGGGTATSLDIAEFEHIHTALSDAFDLSGVKEATIEGSPDTVSPEKLRFLRQLGYTRISFGVQSFHDQRLRKIGRVHRAAQARSRSCTTSRDAYFLLSLSSYYRYCHAAPGCPSAKYY